MRFGWGICDWNGWVGGEEREGEYGKGEERWNGVGSISEEHWFNYDFRHALLFKNLHA